MTSKRARDGRAITQVFDALNRLTQRIAPGSGDAAGNYENFDFAYDLAGRQVSNYHWGVTIANAYDAAGRLSTKKHNGALEIAYAYDAAGNVTKLTYPGGTYFVSHVYDALSRVTRTCEQIEAGSCATAPATGATALLARVSYDPLSRRQSATYRNGTSAQYAYTARGDPSAVPIGSHPNRPFRLNLPRLEPRRRGAGLVRGRRGGTRLRLRL